MFKVGDRVRYTGRGPTVYWPKRIGEEGVLCEGSQDYSWSLTWCRDGQWQGGISQTNLERASPLSPFEADLVAYIEREKRELGI